MTHVFLLLGSNLGHRLQNITDASSRLVDRVGVILKQSSYYVTQSWGKTDQPDFVNQVLLIDTHLLSSELLTEILMIEKDMGRIRDEKWGSRIIDIDILFFGDELIEQDNLIVPHPQLHKRRFTLEPLAEIAPDYVHPGIGKSISELLNCLNDDLSVTRINQTNVFDF